MNNKIFAEGRCQCGAISYEINSHPVVMVQCHCKDCQKASGTGHMSNAFFWKRDVKTKGEAKGYTVTSDEDNQITRHFCSNCGSCAYGTNSNYPDMINIPVGMLDDHSWYSPQAVVYTKRREDWDITNTNIPNFETSMSLDL